MDYLEKYALWLKSVPEEDPLHRELEEMQGDDALIRERFMKDIAFGTAGLRGILGAGTSCMNRYTVGRAAQGIANLICEEGPEAMEKGVVIAHDPRHGSKEFSGLAAEILAGAGIRVYTFPDMRPTPELAYMIRKLGTVSGINITASHNPKEYNGFKAYWEDGCQVSSKVADTMEAHINAVDFFRGIRRGSFEEGVKNGRITVLGPEYDRMYLEEVLSAAVHSGEELDLTVPIVYTPLNGAGAIPFRTMMEERGFTNFRMVPEQTDPDPDFTTVGYPNPESPAAFRMSEEFGRKVGAELLMATDPDADRFAIEILEEDGTYVPLNGNQTGYLIVNYLLGGRRAAGTLPEKGAMVKSIVTGSLSSEIAAHYGVKMFEALTGFKNICGRIPFLQKNGYTYLLGYEESVGYAVCPEIRDKDGISAGMIVAEAAAYYRKRGLTLRQVLDGLYETYGYAAEDEPNLVLKGLDGAARISRMMASLRADLPKEAAGRKVVRVIDYREGFEDIPPSDVLRFFLENGSWFAVRPSGTEPKIKFYFYTKADSREKAAEVNGEIRDDVLARVSAVE